MSALTEKGASVFLMPQVARSLVAEVFRAAGCNDDEAVRVSNRLVDADLRGHPSHGIARTARYVQWLDDGLLKPNQKISIEVENDVFAIIEGNYGFGQTIGEQTVELGIRKARKFGVSVTALRNSGHLGCISDWAELAAAKGIASIHFVNVRGSLLVAPYGGKSARGGTSPICCGIPGPGGRAVVLDFATSKVAEGKALVAYRGGAELAEDAFVGTDGEFSNDPGIFYGDQGDRLYPRPGSGGGALTPFGLHKGSGLNFFAEIFAGALTGSGTAGSIGEETRRKMCNGMLSFFIEVAQFDRSDKFATEVKNYIEFFKSSAPIKAGDEVLIPGEKENRLKAERLANGIPVAGGIWTDILNTADHLKIPRERVQQIVEGEVV